MRPERRYALRSALRQRSLSGLVMALTGANWCGHASPPMTNKKVYVEQPLDDTTFVLSYIDDGGWVGIGHPDSWHVTSIRPATMRRFAWFVLKCWAADWFGLRSALYYRALGASCGRGWGRLGKPDRVFARASDWDRWHAHERKRLPVPESGGES